MIEQTLYIPHHAAIDPATFFDKPAHSRETTYNKRTYCYEGRYIVQVEGWRKTLSRLASVVLKNLYLSNWIQPVCSFLGQKRVHVYREEKETNPTTSQDLLQERVFQDVSGSYDLKNLSEIKWNPKTLTFDLQQKWVPHADLKVYDLQTAQGRFAWIVIPPNDVGTGKQRNLNNLFHYSVQCLVPLAPTIKQFHIEFNQDGWLKMTFPQTPPSQIAKG